MNTMSRRNFCPARGLNQRFLWGRKMAEISDSATISSIVFVSLLDIDSGIFPRQKKTTVNRNSIFVKSNDNFNYMGGHFTRTNTST